MKTHELNGEENYDATYHFGNTVVHVVSPEAKTPEEIEKILEEYHRAGWEIWNETLKKKKDMQRKNKG